MMTTIEFWFCPVCGRSLTPVGLSHYDTIYLECGDRHLAVAVMSVPPGSLTHDRIKDQWELEVERRQRLRDQGRPDPLANQLWPGDYRDDRLDAFRSQV